MQGFGEQERCESFINELVISLPKASQVVADIIGNREKGENGDGVNVCFFTFLSSYVRSAECMRYKQSE